MKVAGVLVVALLVAVVVAGCGGGRDSDTAAVTKAEFAKQASSICNKTAAKRDAAAVALFKEQRKRGEPSRDEVQEQTEEVLLEAVLPALSQMTDELAKLARPAEGGDEVEAIIRAYRLAIEEAEDNPGRLIDGNANPLVEPREMAVSYGAKGCSQV